MTTSTVESLEQGKPRVRRKSSNISPRLLQMHIPLPHIRNHPLSLTPLPSRALCLPLVFPVTRPSERTLMGRILRCQHRGLRLLLTPKVALGSSSDRSFKQVPFWKRSAMHRRNETTILVALASSSESVSHQMAALRVPTLTGIFSRRVGW